MGVEFTSRDVGRFALEMALTKDRMTEGVVKKQIMAQGVSCLAMDFGGKFVEEIPKILSNAVVAAQKAGIVPLTHNGEGAILGAVAEALQQLKYKAIGFNVGGKLGVARYKEHLCVGIYMNIGILNLNEVSVALAHRTVAM